MKRGDALAGIGKLHLRQAQFLAALPNSLAQIFGIAVFPRGLRGFSLAKRYLRIRMHNLPISYYFSNDGHYSTKWEDSSISPGIFPFGKFNQNTRRYCAGCPFNL